MKLNGTHHQSPRVHDRLMKSTSPRLDDHLSLFSFYLKLVSISVQNELGRIHIWKNIFLFFLMYIWACFFGHFINFYQFYNSDDLPAEASSGNFTFIANNKISSDKKNYPPRQEIVVFFWCCVSTTEKVLVWFFLLTDWGASVILLWDLIMNVSDYVCIVSSSPGLGGTGSGSDLDLIWTWSGSDSVWIWSEENAADSVVFFNYSDLPNFITARLRWSISRDQVTANISMAETEPLK